MRSHCFTVVAAAVLMSASSRVGASSVAVDEGGVDSALASQLVALAEARYPSDDAPDARSDARSDDSGHAPAPSIAHLVMLTEHLTGAVCPDRLGSTALRLAWCLDALVADAAMTAPDHDWSAYYRTPSAAMTLDVDEAVVRVTDALERGLGVVSSTDLGNVELQSGTIGWPAASGYFVLPDSTDDGDFTFVPDAEPTVPTDDFVGPPAPQ